MASKYDWDKISKEYIEAPSDDVRPQLRDLAAKYGMSLNFIQQRSAKEKWVEQAKIFLRRVSQESSQQKASSLAGEQTKFDADILTVARALQGQIIGHLNEAKQTKTLLPPKDISQLTTSLSTIQRIGRTALDLDTWTPDKIVNEALKLGFIVTDPRFNASNASADGEGDREDGGGTGSDAIPFNSIVARANEVEPTIIPAAQRDLSVLIPRETGDRVQEP